MGDYYRELLEPLLAAASLVAMLVAIVYLVSMVF